MNNPSYHLPYHWPSGFKETTTKPIWAWRLCIWYRKHHRFDLLVCEWCTKLQLLLHCQGVASGNYLGVKLLSTQVLFFQ